MTLIENMDFIREAIKTLECPMKIPKGTTLAYKEVFKQLSEYEQKGCIGCNIEYLQKEFEEDFIPYFDRFKEEEEGIVDGRYPKKRVGFKV